MKTSNTSIFRNKWRRKQRDFVSPVIPLSSGLHLAPRISTWFHVTTFVYSTDFTLPCYLIITTTIATCSEARKGTEQRLLLFHTFVIMAQMKINCLFHSVDLSEE